MVSNTIIAVIKKEVTDDESSVNETVIGDHNEESIWNTYKLGFKILWIPSVRTLILLLLTVKVTWAFYDGVSFFKFLDSGISNEKMIPLNAISIVPARIIAPLIIAKYAAGPTPMKFYIHLMPYRTLFSLIGLLIICLTPHTISYTGVAPSYIYFVYLINDIFYMFCLFSMYATMTAFFVKISDPSVGGTYMTMLNTIDHLGGLWPLTLSLWLVEYLTWRDCTSAKDSSNFNSNSTDLSHSELDKACPIIIDGFYIETSICLIFGLLWYKWGIVKVKHLEVAPLNSWRITRNFQEPTTEMER